MRSIPLARRSLGWRHALTLLLAVGLGVVLLLWAGFLADYPLTRDIYVSVAIVHILAEVPFLLRAL
jgi:multidrug resistance efflux pump